MEIRVEKKSKPKLQNVPTRLLTSEENTQIYRLIGNRCVTLSTTVVQLFCTEAPYHTQWLKRDSGILCFVKDNSRKNYFFRLFCLKRNQMIWEHEMYSNMDYIESTFFMHLFEGEDGIVAFNFASEDEAKSFKSVVQCKINSCRKKHEVKESANDLIPTSSMRIQGSFDYKKTPDSSNKENRRRKTRNYTKSDIGNPFDFKHVTHVGWDPQSGLDIGLCEDEELRKFFEKAGVSKTQLDDPNTREFIYNFINSHGGTEAVNETMENNNENNIQKINETPPVVPPRAATRPHVRTAPPPPPPPPSSATSIGSKTNNFNNNNNNNININNNNDIKSFIQPPPHLSDCGGMQFVSSTPPPPPMMTSLNGPPPPPLPEMNSALMDSIKSGTTLKPVEERKLAPVVDDSRSDLMSEIRKGLKLKPVCERDVKASNNVVIQERKTDLAGALARALAERNKALHSEDDSDEENEEDSNDEWED